MKNAGSAIARFRQESNRVVGGASGAAARLDATHAMLTDKMRKQGLSREWSTEAATNNRDATWRRLFDS